MTLVELNSEKSSRMRRMSKGTPIGIFRWASGTNSYTTRRDCRSTGCIPRPPRLRTARTDVRKRGLHVRSSPRLENWARTELRTGLGMADWDFHNGASRIRTGLSSGMASPGPAPKLDWVPMLVPGRLSGIRASAKADKIWSYLKAHGAFGRERCLKRG